MKPEILIVDSLHEAAEEILKRHSDEFSWKILPWKQIASHIHSSHFLICRAGHKIAKDILSKAARLKLVVVAGVGLDNIDLEYAAEASIEVTNAQEANATSTAELTLALLLGLARNVVAADVNIRRKRWRKNDLLRKQLRGVELRGKTFGILGLGRVGSRVADRARAFEMLVIACDPYIQQEEAKKVPLVSQKELFERSDFLSLHVPLTNETRRMVNTKSLRLLKKSSFLINTARGAIVDEKAVVQALRCEKLKGYATDVFEIEPPGKKSPLLRAPRTLLTPHLGAQTNEAQKAVAVQAIQRVIDFVEERVS